MKIVRECLQLPLDEAFNKIQQLSESYDEEGRALRQFHKLWIWGAVRHSGNPDLIQERYFQNKGRDKFWYRINRVRKVLGLEPIK